MAVGLLFSRFLAYFTFYTYFPISLVFLLLFALLCCYPCFYFNNITSGSGVGGVRGGDLNSDGG